MKYNNLVTAAICSMFLFAGTAQACYYEGDPVKTASGYDTPATSSSSTCYYDGDPVMDNFGNYDSPVISMGHGDYYTADLPEKFMQKDNGFLNVEISAFESEDDAAGS